MEETCYECDARFEQRTEEASVELTKNNDPQGRPFRVIRKQIPCHEEKRLSTLEYHSNDVDP